MITVILPVFNEQASIGQIIEEIKKSLKREFQILVIDDGSTDNSASIALQNGALVKSHPYRLGNGAAIKTGIRNAQGDILVLMDADGQHNPEDIPRLLEHIDRYDMVVGARYENSQVTIHRSLANKIYNCLASYVTGIRIMDLTSGFRVIGRDVASKLAYLLPNGFSYPTTLTLAIAKTGRSIKYIPITTYKRTGKSKIKILSDGLNFFLIIAKITTLFSPFKIFLPVSAFFFLLGLSYYAYTYFTFHRFTNMSVLLITTSVIIFMLGLISEQISQLRFIRSEDNSPDL